MCLGSGLVPTPCTACVCVKQPAERRVQAHVQGREPPIVAASIPSHVSRRITTCPTAKHPSHLRKPPSKFDPTCHNHGLRYLAIRPSWPQLQLRTAQLSDLPAIARAWQAAFFDDEIIGKLMHPHRKEHPEDVYYFLLRGLRERFWDWRHQYVVVTAREADGQERIAGAADWRRLGEGGKRRELASVDPRTSCVPLCHTNPLPPPSLRTYATCTLQAKLPCSLDTKTLEGSLRMKEETAF